MSDAPQSKAASPQAPRVPLAMVRRAVLWGALGVVALAVPIAVRAAVDGRAALAEAEATEDLDLRIERLGHAARWRLPLASHDEAALDALLEIGESAEAEASLAAYREARRAMLATRAWGLSDPARFTAVNERIASAMAAQEEADGTDVGGRGDPYAHHLALLEQVPGPDPVRAGIAAWSFVAWLVALVGFVGRGLDDKGRLQARPATRWGLAVLLLLAMWTVLLATA